MQYDMWGRVVLNRDQQYLILQTSMNASFRCVLILSPCSRIGTRSACSSDSPQQMMLPVFLAPREPSSRSGVLTVTNWFCVFHTLVAVNSCWNARRVPCNFDKEVTLERSGGGRFVCWHCRSRSGGRVIIVAAVVVVEETCFHILDRMFWLTKKKKSSLMDCEEDQTGRWRICLNSVQSLGQ